MKKICTLLSLLPMLLFSSVQGVLAIEFEITGNSNESNEVNVSSSNTTQVTQTNNATVNNDITVNADTGNNSASNNSGETSITTGNVETNVSVENSLNTSVAQAGCCPTDPNIAKISGNTNSGNNTISVNSSANNSISINQVATINNLVNGSANTGKNSANNNAGNVKISTGWIKQADTITNKNVNVAQAVIFVGDPAWNVTISGNTNDGDNAVLLNLTNNAIVSIYNNADLSNVSLWKLTTGDNTAKDNAGSVTITTGSIYASTAIKNEGINVSHAKVECCDEKVTPPPPPPPPPPPGGCVSGCGGNGDNPKVSNGNGGVGGSGSSAGSVLGGAILPATGMSFWLFATIANIFMFLLGLYLRMKAGRSPTHAYATR